MVHKLIGAALVSMVDGHGYISNPVSRGVQIPPYRYEKQSMGATGGGATIPVCGRENAHVQTRRTVEGSEDPVTELPLGSDYTFEAYISAHHMGHMTVRICPFINNDFTADDLQDCYVVKGSDDLGTDHEMLAPFWWLTPGTGVKTWTGRLPTLDQLPDSPTGVYTLQWRWNTANSCSIHKKAYSCAMNHFNLFGSETCHGECVPNNVNCPTNGNNFNLYDGRCQETICCSEVFTNCADVTFEGVASDISATTAGGSGAVPTPAPPTPEPGSGGSGGSGCVHNTNCDESNWCNDAAGYATWCTQHSDAECPSPQCKVGGGSSGAQPEPEPEPENPAHTISVGAGIDGTGLSRSSVRAFCRANKEVLCAETTLSVVANSLPLCSCTPAVSADPEPEPEPAPAPAPEPSGAGSTTSGSGSDESLDCNECKDKCSEACGYANKRNQCWGTPRYIECTCADDSVHTFEGCPCEHGNCPASLAQMNATSASTKFSGRIHRVVTAAGEIQAEVTQHEH